jgi:hypothetical protein
LLSVKKLPVNIIPKSFLKCCSSKAENGTQNDILGNESEQSGKGASSSDNESATVGSWTN